MNLTAKNNEDIIRKYLQGIGYDATEIKHYLRGFDLSKPVYEQRLEDEVVYQYMRAPSANYSQPKLGNWFCLFGSNMTRLGIFSGAGRILVKAKIQHPLIALEGTASEMPIAWQDDKEKGEAFGVGGKGGATQIFIPSHLINSSIIVLGYLNEVPPMIDSEREWLADQLPD